MSTVDSPSRWHDRAWLHAAMLVVATSAVFGPVVGHQLLVWDDHQHVTAVVDYAADTMLIYVDGVLRSTTGTVDFVDPAAPNTPSSSAALGAEDVKARFSGL